MSVPSIYTDKVYLDHANAKVLALQEELMAEAGPAFHGAGIGHSWAITDNPSHHFVRCKTPVLVAQIIMSLGNGGILTLALIYALLYGGRRGDKLFLQAVVLFVVSLNMGNYFVSMRRTFYDLVVDLWNPAGKDYSKIGWEHAVVSLLNGLIVSMNQLYFIARCERFYHAGINICTTVLYFMVLLNISINSAIAILLFGAENSYDNHHIATTLFIFFQVDCVIIDVAVTLSLIIKLSSMKTDRSVANLVLTKIAKMSIWTCILCGAISVTTIVLVNVSQTTWYVLTWKIQAPIFTCCLLMTLIYRRDLANLLVRGHGDEESIEKDTSRDPERSGSDGIYCFSTSVDGRGSILPKLNQFATGDRTTFHNRIGGVEPGSRYGTQSYVVAQGRKAKRSHSREIFAKVNVRKADVAPSSSTTWSNSKQRETKRKELEDRIFVERNVTVHKESYGSSPQDFERPLTGNSVCPSSDALMKKWKSPNAGSSGSEASAFYSLPQKPDRAFCGENGSTPIRNRKDKQIAPEMCQEDIERTSCDREDDIANQTMTCRKRRDAHGNIARSGSDHSSSCSFDGEHEADFDLNLGIAMALDPHSRPDNTGTNLRDSGSLTAYSPTEILSRSGSGRLEHCWEDGGRNMHPSSKGSRGGGYGDGISSLGANAQKIQQRIKRIATEALDLEERPKMKENMRGSTVSRNSSVLDPEMSANGIKKNFQFRDEQSFNLERSECYSSSVTHSYPPTPTGLGTSQEYRYEVSKGDDNSDRGSVLHSITDRRQGYEDPDNWSYSGFDKRGKEEEGEGEEEVDSINSCGVGGAESLHGEIKRE
ncbi:hypothetical protein IE53DRAFT_385151 [Violaceomyces palustris]|uniref:Uncharacterized protein n=1 Tax=Violaceomyces palustris TaxID=1673888 RepID=A0ACD0P2Q4_9BASI|nr:hypothetical protein IE53DRAFT_385151 [Violaceomyces palustris]